MMMKIDNTWVSQNWKLFLKLLERFEQWELHAHKTTISWKMRRQIWFNYSWWRQLSCKIVEYLLLFMHHIPRSFNSSGEFSCSSKEKRREAFWQPQKWWAITKLYAECFWNIGKIFEEKMKETEKERKREHKSRHLVMFLENDDDTVPIYFLRSFVSEAPSHPGKRTISLEGNVRWKYVISVVFRLIKSAFGSWNNPHL